MKIVIISECTAREMIVVQQIINHFPATEVIQPTYPKKRRKLSALPKRILMKRQYNLLREKIFGKNPIPKPPNHQTLPASKLNTGDGLELLKSMAPDILITCRAPLLSREILQSPKIAAINVHYGIAPKYRGNDSLFWALYSGDHKHLGGCLHYISEGVDTGNILAAAYPDLSSKDNEISIGIKTSRLLAETLIEYLYVISHTGKLSPGRPQVETGKNYKYSERTLLKCLRVLFPHYFFKRKSILSTPARIDRYFSAGKTIPL